MLFRSRNRLKRAGRAFLALVAGLWLTAALAPCAMAMASVVPMPGMKCLPGHAKANAPSAGADVAAVADCHLQGGSEQCAGLAQGADTVTATGCHLPDVASQNNLVSPIFDIPAAGVPAMPLTLVPVRHGVPPGALRTSVSIPEPPPLLRNSVLLI